jgi:photosystem II stability/assembly factor-like uncharacterized protein
MRRSRSSLPALLFAFLVAGRLLAASALLHHPHDVVIDVDLPPNFPDDPTVFVSSPGTMDLFLKSRNYGLSWVNARRGMRGAEVLEFEPASDWESSGTGYAALGSGGIQQTRDGGRTWEDPLLRGYVSRLALAPIHEGGQTLFFGGWTRLRRSDDGGLTSRDVGVGTFLADIESIALPRSYHQESIVAVGTRDGKLHLSRDGGATWTSSTLEGVPKRIAFSPRFPADRTIWVATHGAGVLRSSDAGVTFSRASRGLRDPDINDVVPASNPECLHVFAATRDDGVFRSEDGGDTWELLPLRVPKSDQTDDHHRKLAVSPRYPEDPRIYCATFEGLYFSFDGGKTWTESNLDPTRIGRRIEVSPRFAEDGTAYAVTYGNPVLRSRDRGDTWQMISGGFMGLSSYSLAISPTFDREGLILFGVAEGMRRSTDGGETWTRIRLEPVHVEKRYWPYEIRKIVFSPDFAKDRTVFAACTGGIYKSTDAGETWNGIPPPGPWLRRVTMSPNWTQDRTLFAAGLSIFRSTDDGATWSRPVGRVPRRRLRAGLPDVRRGLRHRRPRRIPPLDEPRGDLEGRDGRAGRIRPNEPEALPHLWEGRNHVRRDERGRDLRLERPRRHLEPLDGAREPRRHLLPDRLLARLREGRHGLRRHLRGDLQDDGRGQDLETRHGDGVLRRQPRPLAGTRGVEPPGLP